MTLFTKCILAEESPEDGLRVSVMSRHTLNDGSTAHPNIYPDSFDEWWHELAPSDKLVGDYYKRGLSWEDFSAQYLESLKEDNKAKAVSKLAELALGRDVTIVCIEVNPEQCHRRLLAEECKLLIPDLEIVIR